MTERGHRRERRDARARAAHLGPELRRPMILDAALPLFAHQGYDTVSMQAIADAAGVSKPVLYSCFASKDELFDQLARREDRRLWKLVAQVAPPADREVDDDDHEALLRLTLTAILRAVEEMPDAFRVLYVQAYGENRIERGRAHWQQRMREVVAERSGRSGREADVIGRLLVAVTEMAFTVMLDEPETWRADDLATFLAHVAVGGILAGDHGAAT